MFGDIATSENSRGTRRENDKKKTNTRPFYRQRQAVTGETRVRGVRFPHTRGQAGGGVRDRDGHGGREFRAPGGRHNHQHQRHVRAGRVALGVRGRGARRLRRPGAGSGQDLRHTHAGHRPVRDRRPRGVGQQAVEVQRRHEENEKLLAAPVLLSENGQLSLLLQVGVVETSAFLILTPFFPALSPSPSIVVFSPRTLSLFSYH